jgi:hypothetical protein
MAALFGCFGKGLGFVSIRPFFFFFFVFGI